MTIKIKNKEYSFDGYVQPLQSAQQLAEECYEQGRADKYFEITSEYMLLTDEQVAEIRADAIEEVISYLRDYGMIDCNCCTENNRCDRDCWDVIAEQLKEQKNE